MKFGRAHRILTTALAACGILALLGSVPLPGLAPVQVLVELLVGAQLVAVAARRGASNDTAVFVLSLVHFLLATMLGGGIAFVIGFVGLALVLPASLVLSHLRREVEGNYSQGARDRSGLPVDVPRILRSRRVMDRRSLLALVSLAVPLLSVTALLFVAIPRTTPIAGDGWLSGLGLDPGLGRVRFSDTVDLGQHGALRANPTPALRFRVDGQTDPPPARMPLRFRGATLDAFDGRVWTRSQREVLRLHAPASAHDRAITIEREPFEPAVTLVPAGTVALRSLDERALRYVAWVSSDPTDEPIEPLSSSERAHHLALPSAMPSRIAELAHAWTDGEITPGAKARAIEQHLRRELAYDLASPSRGADQPVDHFLFESKRGHCELFAAAMATMLREVGIPSRSVTGFVGGTYNRFGGYYVVRQGEAHAWVEAYVDGPRPGWRTFDPTPALPAVEPSTGLLASSSDLGDAFARRWGSDVVSYDRHAQAAIVDVLRAPLAIAVGLVVVALVALGARRTAARSSRGTRRPDGSTAAASEVAGLYASLEAALGAKGIVRDRSMPPLAHAERLVEASHPLATDVIALTRIYLETRFGGRPLTGDARRDFERGVARVAAWQRA
ncbi:MAG: Transglutaminase-like enzyme putative cysteine protease [Labilithrix sp.]|nr:Transglutaminase-like enzyme putative cysteine protease [Labilithrix sp.]